MYIAYMYLIFAFHCYMPRKDLNANFMYKYNKYINIFFFNHIKGISNETKQLKKQYLKMIKRAATKTDWTLQVVFNIEVHWMVIKISHQLYLKFTFIYIGVMMHSRSCFKYFSWHFCSTNNEECEGKYGTCNCYTT